MLQTFMQCVQDWTCLFDLINNFLTPCFFKKNCCTIMLMKKKVKLELERNDYLTIVFPSLTHSSL